MNYQLRYLDALTYFSQNNRVSISNIAEQGFWIENMRFLKEGLVRKISGVDQKLGIEVNYYFLTPEGEAELEERQEIAMQNLREMCYEKP